MSSPEIRTLAAGVHVVDMPQRFLGVSVGARMTLLEVDGGVLVHSPVDVDPGQLAHLGAARWVLAPNLLHHLYLRTWADRGIDAFGPAGLPEKRPDVRFAGILDDDDHPFGPDIEILPLTCFPLTREIVVFHRPSRTLVVTDLVFHFGRHAPWMTRCAMRCLRGYPGCRTTLLERFGMRRDAARAELAQVAAWDFDRLVMAHGDVIESGGRSALLGAFAWLGVPRARQLRG